MQFNKEEQAIIDNAITLIESKIQRGAYITSPADSKSYLKLKLATLEAEVFVVLFLTTQNQVIEVREMFRGTIDSSAVYPREVVKAALQTNAAALIFAHNHPSGVAEPSQADIIITERLKQALELIDVRVLDHLIITNRDITSLSERGLI